MINPSNLQKPRSSWPKGAVKVSAWHLDKHISPLFRATDVIAARFPPVSPAQTLPLNAIRELAHLAATTDSAYDATAAMDHLYDAPESFPETLNALERLLEAHPTIRKRIFGCMRYLLAGGINRRAIQGRHFSEVSRDYEYFQSLLKRVDELEGG